MVQDHQKTPSELKALVDDGKVKAKLPSALDAEHQKILDDLKAKNFHVARTPSSQIPLRFAACADAAICEKKAPLRAGLRHGDGLMRVSARRVDNLIALFRFHGFNRRGELSRAWRPVSGLSPGTGACAFAPEGPRLLDALRHLGHAH
jgi:hypothetical protein